MLKSREYKTTQALAHIVGILFTLAAIIPFILLIVSSFTDNAWVSANGFSFLPGAWSMDAYRYIGLKWTLIGRAYGMTILVTVIGTAVSLVISSLFAYGISKSHVPGMKLISFLLIFTMLFNGGIVSTYYCYIRLWHVKDTIWALIIPGLLMNAFNVILLRNYYVNNIPASLDEAARIDGAGEWRILMTIVTPLSKPILATVGLMTALAYWNDWINVYKRLVHWELELSATDSSMTEMLKMQKEEANNGFAKYIKKNYLDWIASTSSSPLMSPQVFKSKVFPLLNEGKKVFLVVLDNFRYDQWRVLAPELSEQFEMEEDLYYSILPTATQYARNAIFSGLMPKKIAEMFPDLWVDEDEEEGKNLNEEPLIRTQMERYRRKNTFSYHKVNNQTDADKLLQQFNSLEKNDLNVVVFNFIDMLSHARTESKMVRELANNESAYRSITLSWFRHSVISDFFKQLAQTDYKVIVTTDHGSIRCTQPVKILGDRNTNTNLRYKLGKNLAHDDKSLFVVKEPQRAQLPSPNLSTSYVFATGDSFFAYPNNYNYYVSYYRDTFQHGGISMEEMLIPLITLTGKKR